MAFKAPYFPYEALRERAASFLKQFHPQSYIPVPIENIAEADLNLDIVPMPGLRDGFDIDAFLTPDLQEIRVDEYIYRRNPNRYRFSLAHEIGHLILHSDIFTEFSFSTVQEWKQITAGFIPEDQYLYLEFHANSFAGLVLVPSDELRSRFFDYVERGEERSVDFDDPATGVRDAIEAYLAQDFQVSSAVIHRRIEFDGLWHK